MKLSQLSRETKPADFDKLKGYNPKRPNVDEPKWPSQITRGQANESWALYKSDKSNLSRVSWGDQYIACTKLASPVGNNLLEGYYSLASIASRPSKTNALAKMNKKRNR